MMLSQLRTGILVVLLVCSLSSFADALTCGECDVVLQPAASGTYTDYDNDVLNYPAGTVMCLSSQVTYGTALRFTNFIGSAGNKFVLTNCGGVAKVTTVQHSILLLASRGFHITGTGDAGNMYGIQISNGAFGILIAGGTDTDIEVDHVEIKDNVGHAAISCKSDPTEPQWTRESGFVMERISFHHNYIHDIATEGFYIGYNNYENPGPAGHAHQIHDLEVYDNIVDKTQWDGIQVGCTTSNGKVYRNTVTNFGLQGNSNQDNGMIFGTGVIDMEVYGNYIETGTSSSIGILYHGNGNLDLYNNVIINPGNRGIALSVNSARSDVPSNPYLNVHHNTVVVLSNNIGINSFVPTLDTDGVTKKAHNNAVVYGNGQSCVSGFAGSDSTGNACNQGSVPASWKLNSDYIPASGSALAAAGVTGTGVTKDYNCQTRPSPPTIGAFEVNSTPTCLVNPVPTPTATPTPSTSAASSSLSAIQLLLAMAAALFVVT